MNEAAARSSWDVQEQSRALSQGTRLIKDTTAPGRLRGRQGKEPGGACAHNGLSSPRAVLRERPVLDTVPVGSSLRDKDD